MINLLPHNPKFHDPQKQGVFVKHKCLPNTLVSGYKEIKFWTDKQTGNGKTIYPKSINLGA